MNTTNYSNISITKSNLLAETVTKYPKIGGLVERGRGYLEQKLGATINDDQLASLINRFINWRDHSEYHHCLKDILNVKEVNDCFENVYVCNKSNSTRRNVITKIRKFFTCKDRNRLRNVIVIGNYTINPRTQEVNNATDRISNLKSDKYETNNKRCHRKLRKGIGGETELTNEKICDEMEGELTNEAHTGIDYEAAIHNGTNPEEEPFQKWMFDSSSCDDAVNSLHKCQLDAMQKAANKSRGSSESDEECDKEVRTLQKCIKGNNTIGNDDDNDDDDVDGCILNAVKLHKCKLKASLSSKMSNNTFNDTIDECRNYEDIFRKCTMTPNKTVKYYNACDDTMTRLERCKLKLKFSKAISSLCDEYADAFEKCQLKNKNHSIVPSKTCNETASSLENCKARNKESPNGYEKECIKEITALDRCMQKHVSHDIFSGSIQKIDTINSTLKVDGGRNETFLNETSDFEIGNASYTMRNLTTFKQCEGCLRNKSKDENTFLNFNPQAETRISNVTNAAGGMGKSFKKYLLKSENPKCRLPNTIAMSKSVDDDDLNTVKEECDSTATKRRLISNHVKTKTTKTSGDRTVSQKAKEGTKVTDEDTGKEIPQGKVQEESAGGQTHEEHQKNEKILQDILNGKHDKSGNAEAVNQQAEKVQSIDNRTIPVDSSMLPQKGADRENPDADVGIVGIDTHPAIEAEIENMTRKNMTAKHTHGDRKNEEFPSGDGEVEKESSNEKDKQNIKSKDKTYWLGGDPNIEKNNATPTPGNKTLPKPPKEKLKRILCFGDSITKGYYAGGKKYHPYSIKLEALLKEDGVNVQVLTHGVNGECVSLEMQKRLARDLEELPKLDLVIILGGTNDLLSMDCVRTVDLFQEIKNLHLLVRAKQYNSVVVTVPETKQTVDGTEKMSLLEYKKELDETNQKMRMYAVAAKLPLIDLADDFSRHSIPGKTNVSSLWDDDIHPSREGYDRIGEIIYSQIKSLF